MKLGCAGRAARESGETGGRAGPGPPAFWNASARNSYTETPQAGEGDSPCHQGKREAGSEGSLRRSLMRTREVPTCGHHRAGLTRGDRALLCTGLPWPGHTGGAWLLVTSQRPRSWVGVTRAVDKDRHPTRVISRTPRTGGTELVTYVPGPRAAARVGGSECGVANLKNRVRNHAAKCVCLCVHVGTHGGRGHFCRGV